MACAISTVSAALSLLLIGSAAEAMASGAADQPAGATFSSTAATIGSPSSDLAQKPRAWFLAERPRYASDGWRCSPGLVWRNAGPRDWLCVDADEALRIERENEAAAETWVHGPEGPYSCRSGMVRREAFTRDGVCVDPQRRDAVRRMNLMLFSVR